MTTTPPPIDSLHHTVERALLKAFTLGQTYWQQADSEYSSQWKKADATQATYRQLVADTLVSMERIQKLEVALERAELFIDEVRQDLHRERIADWYPEGAHSSASAMSEAMRVIGNRCADFDSAIDAARAALESKT